MTLTYKNPSSLLPLRILELVLEKNVFSAINSKHSSCACARF